MINPIKAILTTLTVVTLTLLFSTKGNAVDPIKKGGTLIIIQDRYNSERLIFDDCPDSLAKKHLTILNERGGIVATYRFVGEIVTVGKSSLGIGYKLVLTQGTCSEEQQL